MRGLHRNKRKLYICEAYQDGNLRKFKEPVLLKENWINMKPSVSFMNIGLDAYDYVRIRTISEHSKYYHLGDRAYIYNEPPTNHDAICKNADYEVCKDPIVTINECEILLKRLSGRNDSSVF